MNSAPPPMKGSRCGVGRKIVVWKAFSLTTLSNISLLLVRQHAGEVNVSLFAVGLCCRDAAKAVVDNLCLRQQLLVLQRRQPRLGLTDSDRRFWILAYRLFSGWRTSLLIVKPETVLRWHWQGWRSYWRRRSSRRGKICKAFLIDDIEQHQPPGGSTPGGEVNVSLFAVGDCCGCPTKGAADRRQSLPPATAAGPAPTQTTATPRGWRPAFLGSGVSVVRFLANAPSGVAELLAPAFKSQREAWAPPDCPGPADPDPSHDHRESTLGSAQDPGGARAAWVQSFGENSRQVYASRPSSRAFFPLAVIPEAARVNCLGVRFLLRPNHHVSNTIRVLRDSSRQPASSARACDGTSDRQVDGTADCRMLRLGLPAATLSRSRPRQLLCRQLRSASA